MSDEFKGKQLRRSRNDRVVAGVCAGLAEYFGIDVYIVRLVFAALAILGGTGILLYLVAWLILPEAGESASIAEGFINKNKS
ncbi:MAG TPA: PspC domain-containing protein [Streptosporangiaceae bacterium]|nr:PspC domain-containing protein [Streptosporangiaceae bacterium]